MMRDSRTSARTAPPRPRGAATAIAVVAVVWFAAVPARADEPPPASAEPVAAPAREPPPTAAVRLPPPPTEPPPAPPVGSPPPPSQPPPVPAEPRPDRVALAPGNAHSVGLTLSFSTGAGFAYRKQWGPTSLQLSLFAIVSDRGNNTLVTGGGMIAHRVHVWSGSGHGLMPATSALRVVGGLNYFLDRTVAKGQNIAFGGNADGVICTNSAGCVADIVTNHTFVNGGAGLGFEFGSIDRPGLSMTLDVVLTAAFQDGAFSLLLPLPQMAVLYNW